MEIIYSSKFAKEYKKIPSDVKDMAEVNFLLFKKDPFDPKLKTHKLNGRLKKLYSFSVGYKYRIIFEFSDDKNIVYFHSVGNHDIYN